MKTTFIDKCGCKISGDFTETEIKKYTASGELSVFATPQEELTEAVYDQLLVKPKHDKIKVEISGLIGGY